MKLSNASMILASFYFLASPLAMAADVSTINITGKVVASPCTVDTANSDLNVDLGDIQANSLATAGSYSMLNNGTEKAFKITLKECPASTSRAVATITGSADSENSDMFANTGTASDVAVSIKKSTENWASSSITPNSTWQSDLIKNGRVEFAFHATAYSHTGNVTPGTVVSTMQVTFTYQ